MLNLSNMLELLNPRGVAAKLSEATGISTSNISDWKKGRSKPTAEALILIADYFDVSIDFLLGRSKIRKSGISGEAQSLEISENGKRMLEYFEGLSEGTQRELIGEAKAYYSVEVKEKAGGVGKAG